MIKMPIKELPKLEKKILRRHIITYPSITTGLPRNIFPNIRQKDVDRAFYNLVQSGYYKNFTDRSSFFFSEDGYYDARSYFLKGPRGSWNRGCIALRTLKQFWSNHWRWIIGIAINIIALYFAWLELRK